MALPDYQELMLPVMQVARDGQIHTNAGFRDAVAEMLDIDEAGRQDMLASGRQRVYDNRIGWAISYLYHAGLLERAGRGRYHITDRGRQVLQRPLSGIDREFLLQFDEFRTFLSPGTVPDIGCVDGKNDDGHKPATELTVTPEEAIEAAYQNWRDQKIHQVLDRAKSCTPQFFEQLVLDVLLAMGYGGSRRDAAEAVGRSGDGGIDGIIKEDRLGLDVIYVQAKRWEGTVGSPVVHGFAGSLIGKKAQKGILITTSCFSKTAHDYVNSVGTKIILIDGAQLAELMLDYGVGVTQTSIYAVKDIDEDYFENGS